MIRPLTDQQKRIKALLEANAHRRVSWQEIATHLWGVAQPGTPHNTIKVQISKMRYCGVLISNVKREGYKLDTKENAAA